MGNKRKKTHQTRHQLPIDERLLPDIFSFSHVRGVARIFLTIEILLSSLVVFGTLLLVILKCILQS